MIPRERVASLIGIGCTVTAGRARAHISRSLTVRIRKLFRLGVLLVRARKVSLVGQMLRMWSTSHEPNVAQTDRTPP